MRSGNFLIFFILALCFSLFSKAEIKNNLDFPELSGPYFGQKPPGNIPEIFASGVISKKGLIEFSITISSNGQEIYFTRFDPHKGSAVIMATRSQKGIWSKPKPASFSGIYKDREPFIVPDNSKLFFTSSRPRPGKKEFQSGDLWYVDRTTSGWSDPKILGPEINTASREGHPGVSANMTLYFHRITEKHYDIFRSQNINGKFGPIEKLGGEINTDNYIEGEPFIAPDESYLLFISAGRPDRIAASPDLCDIYISFRKNNNEWTPAKILGPKVLSIGEENWPAVSPDGKYLFFSSGRDKNPPFPDIYWVSTDIIKELKERLE